MGNAIGDLIRDSIKETIRNAIPGTIINEDTTRGIIKLIRDKISNPLRDTLIWSSNSL